MNPQIFIHSDALRLRYCCYIPCATVHLELTCGISQGITGDDPYDGVDDDDLLEMKRAKLCPKRPDHSDIDQDLWDVMKKCWNANPHDRGSATDIYEALKNGWPSQRRERPESQ